MPQRSACKVKTITEKTLTWLYLVLAKEMSSWSPGVHIFKPIGSIFLSAATIKDVCMEYKSPLRFDFFLSWSCPPDYNERCRKVKTCKSLMTLPTCPSPKDLRKLCSWCSAIKQTCYIRGRLHSLEWEVCRTLLACAKAETAAIGMF